MQIQVKTQTNRYTITTGRGILRSLRTLLPFAEGKKVMIVTDENVAPLYSDVVVSQYPDASVYVVPAGEESKSFVNAEKIANALAEKGFTRQDYVFALGGGVVGDLAGFVSSIYMRGIPYVQIPTSLLAGIDSSVGGKTAVNIAYGKNLVGRVYPPSAVVFDLNTLDTLPEHFYLDGMGEAIKYALLDGEIFGIMERSPADPSEWIDRCILYKKAIVEQDENESGLRRLLNLGHSFGHAVERESGLTVTHGIAVAQGLRMIVDLCAGPFGCLSSTEEKRIVDLFEKYGLARPAYRMSDLVKHLAVDKKTEGEEINLITVHGIGDCRIEKKPLAEIARFGAERIAVKPAPLAGTVEAIPSKSFAHRILLCAALCGGETVVSGLYPSEDVLATVRCIRALGVDVRYDGVSRAVLSGRPNVSSATFDCGESGSTLRFLLPIVAALGIDGTFCGKGRLSERPIESLMEALRSCGVKTERNPLTVSGKLTSDVVKVDGSLSSQFVSGLLLALSIDEAPKKLIVTGKKVSESYIKITLSVLRAFGVDWDKTSDGYEKKGGKIKRLPAVSVEGDWSNAAFFLVAGAIGKGPVTVKGVSDVTEQGDAVVVDCLRAFGAKTECDKNGATVFPSDLHGAEIDLTDCPDLAPALAVVAAFADGKSVFSGVDRLKIKESDRLQSIIEMLKNVGIRAEENGEKLTIFGGKPTAGKHDGKGDHRMVMAETVLCSVTGGEVAGIDAVNKSYPGFFADYTKLGGIYERI